MQPRWKLLGFVGFIRKEFNMYKTGSSRHL